MGVRRAVVEVVGGAARARTVVLLAAVLALNSADSGTVGALAGQLEQALSIGHTRLGLLATVSGAVGAAVSLPMGALTDRVRRVPILVLTIVAWAAAMAAGGLATSYLWLLLSRLALGAALAASGPVVASLIGDLFPAGERARVFGWVLSGELVGAGVGLVAGAGLAALLSWRWAFFLLAAGSLATAGALWRLLPEPPRRARSTHRMSLSRALRHLLRIPTVRLLIVASSVGYFFFAGLRTFAVVFVERQFGVSQGEIVGLMPLVGAGALAGMLLSGRLTDAAMRRGHRTVRITATSIAYATAAFFFVPGLLISAVPLALVFFTLGAAGLAAANPPLDAARLDIVPGDLWGRAESLRTVLRLAAEAAAPVTFGFVADRTASLRDTFLIMLVPLLANASLVLLARRSYLADAESARRATQDR